MPPLIIKQSYRLYPPDTRDHNTGTAMLRISRHLQRICLIFSSLAIAIYFAAHMLIAPVASLIDRHPKPPETPKDWGYHFELIEIQGGVCNTAGNRMTVWYVQGDPGKGQVILLPNNGGNKGQPLIRWTTEILINAGFSAVLVDPRAQGDSKGIRTYGFGEALDIIKVIDELSTRYPQRPIGGLGYSVGAATLLRVVGMERRLRAVASFATYARMDANLIRQELTYQSRGRWSGQGILPGLVGASFRFWALSLKSIPSPAESVRTVRDQHVLLMHFKEDPELPLEYSLEIFEQAPLELVDLHIYDEKKHVPWRRTPEFEADFIERITAFFSQHLKNEVHSE